MSHKSTDPMYSPLDLPYSHYQQQDQRNTNPAEVLALPLSCNMLHTHPWATTTDLSFFRDLSFESFTLCRAQFTTAAVLFATIHVVICVALRVFVSEKKKLAWGVSLVNAGVLSILGSVYLYHKRTLLSSALTTGVGGQALLQSVDDFSALVCLWFAIVNVTDLLFGGLCYPSQLGLFTALGHHPFYLWVMVTAITGNGGLVQIRPFASGFVLASIQEFPTFLLALGVMVPTFRTDLGFGFSFFLLRVCYHFLLVASTVYFQLGLASTLIPSVGLVMHLYWFWGWMMKYGPRLVPTFPKVPS